MSSLPASGTPSEFAETELPLYEIPEDAGTPPPWMPGYPPFAPYAKEPVPPSVAETIATGISLRIQHKSTPKKTMRPLPRPAKPKRPKVTDVKMSQKQVRAHSRCLRRHGAVLTDRLERMSKPRRRNVICMWREHADMLPSETIARLRSMLDADEPFKPDQAYEYFVNLRKTKKKAAGTRGLKDIKKRMLTVCGDKRFAWARNATVSLAKGIQQRLSKPGRYALADGMLRLSDIVLEEICDYMRVKIPPRSCPHPKSKLLLEMADKIAIWIDEILSQSDDRMLMMDFDEDEDLSVTTRVDAAGDAGFADDFLNMMAGGGQLAPPKPAYLKFTGEMLEAFKVLTDSMYKKGSQPLVSHGKFKQSYAEGADELRQATDFDATQFDSTLADQLSDNLSTTVAPNTPERIKPQMKEMVNICSNYLAQNAEMNKDKGPAFKLLLKNLRSRPNEQLYNKGKAKRTFAQAATELEKAKGLESDRDDPNLSQELHSKFSKLVEADTPPDLKTDMAGSIPYLQIGETLRGNQGRCLSEHLYLAAYRIYKSEKHCEETRGVVCRSIFILQIQCLSIGQSGFSAMVLRMLLELPRTRHIKTLDISSKYLSQAAVDENERGPTFDLMINELKKSGGDSFTPEHPALATNYAAANALNNAPGLTVSNPDKGTAPKFKQALHKAVDGGTPPNLKTDMKEVVDRSGDYLSTSARDRNSALQLLLKNMRTNGSKDLAKRNNFALNYGTAATELEAAPGIIPYLPVKDISDEIKNKLSADMEGSTPPALKTAMKALITDAAGHLSQVIALKSGAAGDRYPLSLEAAAMGAMGTKPLYKHKSYGQTYADAAEVLKFAGVMEEDPKSEQLAHEIHTEMKKGLPTVLSPTLINALQETTASSAKHLAKSGMEKGGVLASLIELMRQKGGDSPIGTLQGYQQTYNDCAKRLENATSLANDKVDKGSYELVRSKLKALLPVTLTPDQTKYMAEVVDNAAKYLSSPFPENDSEKRQVLGDLISKKGDVQLAEDGIYKMTYQEGGEEVMDHSIAGKTTAKDKDKKQAIRDKIDDVIPGQRLKEVLKAPADEGAAHLADVVTGRGEAMKAIHDELKHEGGKELVNIGKSQITHEKAADKLAGAQNFTGGQANQEIVDKVTDRVEALPAKPQTELGKAHMEDAKKIAAKFIATQAAGESGLDEAGLNAAAARMDTGAAGGAGYGAGGTQGSPGGAGGIGAGPDGASGGPGGAGGGPGGAGGGPGGAVVGPGGAGGGPGGAGGSPGGAGGGPGGVAGQASGAGGPGAGAGAGASTDGEPGGAGGVTAESATGGGARRGRKARAGGADDEDDEDGAGGRSKRRRGTSGHRSDSGKETSDADRLLQKQLQAHGGEVFYAQPQSQLTHTQAAEWLAKPAIPVDKTVRESGDTDRLSKKFERKLSGIVSKVTPAEMREEMQDVIIESSRKLSEYFVSNNYKALVREALISGMQQRGNEILIEVDGSAETSFFAAQRLKKAKSLDTKEPCAQIAYHLMKRLEDVVRCCATPRKLSCAMKDHIKDAANYLSEHVTKPDATIEAYVSLLGEMEAAGDSNLVEGNIMKSYKDCAAYLRQLTSSEDKINLSNPTMQSNIAGKLQSRMANVTERGYSSSVMDQVIADSTKLLVSYIMLQDAKTEALTVLISKMDEVGDKVLLRHGPIRKLYTEAADGLRGKNTDQLVVESADPVAARKIHIKLENLMAGCTPDKYRPLMSDVIEDATNYLAVYLLEPQIIKVCKCMKSVFVQCELWCEEILRRVSRPCCTCSRHVSVQALQDLAPGQHVRVSPGASRLVCPGLEINIVDCPATTADDTCPAVDPNTCPSSRPTRGDTTSYLLYDVCPTRLPVYTQKDCSSVAPQIASKNAYYYDEEPTSSKAQEECDSTNSSFDTPPSKCFESETKNVTFWSNPTAMFFATSEKSMKKSLDYSEALSGISDIQSETGHAPVVSTDQMSDWHAMMVSLMWNVQAWRDWLQDNIERALLYKQEPYVSRVDNEECWDSFHKRITKEALQWRQYNAFSRQLTLRLALRYRDKRIVSPTRATEKTQLYMEYQKEMLNIIDIFNTWTHWFLVVIKETVSLKSIPGCDTPLHELRWIHFQKKIEEYSKDWTKYNMHLKMCWENKYKLVIADWLPEWKQSGPVWVVSACGAVPSGAVAAGVFESEVIWLARTTHGRNVLPAALLPSKHCCLVYADGCVHYYTRYQVMCNASVRWEARRAGGVGGRTVRAAPGVYIGRVHYRGSQLLGAVLAPRHRCHVVIFNRPFAFNCYELLVLSDDE